MSNESNDLEARRNLLRAQAQLLLNLETERTAPERERARQETHAAYALLAAGQPLAGYARLEAARAAAARAHAPLPSRLAYAEAVLARAAGDLAGFAKEAARALVLVALEVARARGHHPRTSEVLLHLPLVALAQALWPDAKLETARKRLQRALGDLAARGLVAHRARVGNAVDAHGQRLGWRDGTVLRVRLLPGRATPLTREELEHPWRDLQRDIEVGRTARRALSQSNTPREELEARLEALITTWALGSLEDETPPLGVWDTPKDPREAARQALAAITDPATAAGRAVEAAAQALARALRDPGSVRWYAGLLWRARRDPGFLEVLRRAVERTLVDLLEGWARRPGALLCVRLRAPAAAG